MHLIVHHVTQSTSAKPTDEQARILAGRFADGKKDAFELVVAAYRQRIAGLARRLLGWRAEVDDVVQDVFFAAFKARRQFRGESSLWTWLAAITINQCRSRRRKLALLGRLPWRMQHASEYSGDSAALVDETRRQVRRAVEKLPRGERELIVLHYMEGMSAAEIAAMWNMKTNAIEVRLYRARQKLKAMLVDMGID